MVAAPSGRSRAGGLRLEQCQLSGVVVEACHELERARAVAELQPAADRAGGGEAVKLSMLFT